MKGLKQSHSFHCLQPKCYIHASDQNQLGHQGTLSLTLLEPTPSPCFVSHKVRRGCKDKIDLGAPRRPAAFEPCTNGAAAGIAHCRAALPHSGQTPSLEQHEYLCTERLGLTRTAVSWTFCGLRCFSSLQLGDQNRFVRQTFTMGS